MEEILHQLICRLSHYLQSFTHPRWCRISSINSMFQYPFMCPKTSSTSWDWDCELMRPAQEAGIISPGARCNEVDLQQATCFILDTLPQCWDCWITLKLLDWNLMKWLHHKKIQNTDINYCFLPGVYFRLSNISLKNPSIFKSRHYYLVKVIYLTTVRSSVFCTQQMSSLDLSHQFPKFSWNKHSPNSNRSLYPWKNTVDGRNPKQPPGMVKTPKNNGIIIILGG